MTFALNAAGGVALVRDTVVDSQAFHYAKITGEPPDYGCGTMNMSGFGPDSIQSFKGWQYCTYWDQNMNQCLARRKLPDGKWEVLRFTDFVDGTDIHKVTTVGICPGDGSIHLAASSYIFRRDSIPGVASDPEKTLWSTNLFGPRQTTKVIYPCFFRGPDDKLYHGYKNASIKGGNALSEYDPKTHKWTELGQFETPAPYSTMYPDNFRADPKGRIHFAWAWRRVFTDPGTHSDLGYVYSDDGGRTWNNNAGQQVAVSGKTFFSPNTPGIVAQAIPPNRGLGNMEALFADSKGRVHVLRRHVLASAPDTTWAALIANPSQWRYHHYWRETNGVWKVNEIPAFGFRGRLVVGKNGDACLAYVEHGGDDRLKIAIASEAKGWSDWRVVYTNEAFRSLGECFVDYERWITDEVLTVGVQEAHVDANAYSPLHMMDFVMKRGKARRE